MRVYFGDFLVKIYKTSDPSQQSLWSSDVARLNYIVKTVISTNNSSKWTTDKNGIYVKETIVIPLLNYINDKIDIYKSKNSKLLAKSTTNNTSIELLDKINEHGTFLPKSILHADLDRGFLDFIKND